jgi:predicted AlkP superfamily pyrophosphatase or phosphodiesterase
MIHSANRFALISFALFLAACAQPKAQQLKPTRGPDENGVVVIISVDGLAAFYFNDPKADMPNLRAMASEGARASGMRAVTPTVTWPNHTSIVTGVMPGRHGVLGNNCFDRTTNQRVQFIADPNFNQHELLKVPTIYDLAHDAGMKTAALRWPASRGAKTLDWTAPDVWSVSLMRKYTTPSLMAECKEAGIHLDGTDRPPQPEDRMPPGIDGTMTRAFNLILQKHRPRLALLHLTMVDHLQHDHGPQTPKAYEAIREADAQVGEVWEELKRDYPDNATLIIVSDHGFSPIRRMILPNVILRDAGLIDVRGTRIVGGDVQIVAQGGSALVYITPREGSKKEIIERITKALKGHDGIARIVGPGELKEIGMPDPARDPRGPDMVLYAPMGYVFGDTAAGSLAYAEKPERLGSHGHDPTYPALHATFLAWGAGVSRGTVLPEISNTDVAPTVAAMLGISMTNVDGKVLRLSR